MTPFAGELIGTALMMLLGNGVVATDSRDAKLAFVYLLLRGHA